ncbi:DNA-processing protein DprA [Alteromonas oceanisediminis]|uniref:DNA-processing protein DprA n=1 Tax=Alteromonas oceanisediminis TaxID=2836180 RepID=UPI001BD99067|nr:DNA-processing protein DprA [Alteromonas oceanisediminis]MBT0586652.1 DNA-processing protein DprA [Alteromonas oceanisediminis]
MASPLEQTCSAHHAFLIRLSYSVSGGPRRLFTLLNAEKLTLPEIAKRTPAQLARMGFSPAEVKELCRPLRDLAKPVKQALLWHHPELEQYVVCIHDDDYPPLLKQIASPPLVLFLQGNRALLTSHQIAIVGSRYTTHTGKTTAHQLAHSLAGRGITVTSGLAMGIDAAAHRGALAVGGRTLAVLGCGIDQIYPKRNHALYAEITKNAGLLVSEFFPGTSAKAEHFPRRNRIVSGLSLGTVVVEAALKSGSLITARMALEQNRDVFAVPGNIQSRNSEGCHYLIQQGAKLILNDEDILEEYQHLNLAGIQPYLEVTKKSPTSGLASEALLASVDYDVTEIDVIAKRSALAVQDVLAQLLEYELRGLVASVPGGYVKLRGK